MSIINPIESDRSNDLTQGHKGSHQLADVDRPGCEGSDQKTFGGETLRPIVKIAGGQGSPLVQGDRLEGRRSAKTCSSNCSGSEIRRRRVEL